MLLMIPGPVTTRPEVRAALAQDFAPWDNDFRALYASTRRRVLHLAGGSPSMHATLPLQGSGHFAVEAMVRSFVPAGAKLLVPITGSYGERMARLADESGRRVIRLSVPPRTPLEPASVAEALEADPEIGYVGLVQSETGSGIVHDVPGVAALVEQTGRRILLDAVSSFGAIPLDLGSLRSVEAMVFTANKCLEGIAGIAYVVARTERLELGRAGSWSLDLADIHEHAVCNGPGSFRFTPPAQVLAAFAVALDIFEAEGGQPARLARYRKNARTLYDGMRQIGLTPWLPADIQGPVVINVHAPSDSSWDLQRFVDALKRRDILISNFGTTEEPTFRVGCIGALSASHMTRAVAAMDQALDEIGIHHRAGGPVSQPDWTRGDQHW